MQEPNSIHKLPDLLNLSLSPTYIYNNQISVEAGKFTNFSLMHNLNNENMTWAHLHACMHSASNFILNTKTALFHVQEALIERTWHIASEPSPPPFHPLTPRSTPSSPVNPYLPPSLIKNQIIWSNCLTTIPPSTSPPFLVRSEQYQNSEVSLCLTTHKYINDTHTHTHTHTHSLTHQFNSAKVTGRSLGLNWPDMEEAQSNHQLRPNHTFISPAHNTAII